MSATSFVPEIERIISSSDSPEKSRELLSDLRAYSSSFIAEMNMLLTRGTPNAMQLAESDLLAELELLTSVEPFLMATGQRLDYKQNLIETHVWAKWTVGNFFDENGLTDIAEDYYLIREMYDLLMQAHKTVSDNQPAPTGNVRMLYWRGLNIAAVAAQTIIDNGMVGPETLHRLAQWAATRDDALAIRATAQERQTLNPDQLEAVLGEKKTLAPSIRDGAL